MGNKLIKDEKGNYNAWVSDQITKSEFFHQKLHEWELIEVAQEIENIKGEDLDWEIELLGITKKAWEKVIHRGIKPVIVFAHPQTLSTIERSVSYYRMLSLVSQKSMNNLSLAVARFESGKSIPDYEKSQLLAQHLNEIISRLIQADENLDAREFDLWRGMAAGSQAQGSWNNIKGDRIEEIVKGVFKRRIKQKSLVQKETGNRFVLIDGRIIELAEEPDIAFYRSEEILAAIEIKGGIDTAGVLERVGAAIKSLSRAVTENPKAKTILLLQGVSMSEKAEKDLLSHQDAVQHWFTIESFLEDENIQQEIFGFVSI